ncbi:Membrane proteinase PrsW, cleaves anti-sigma factor RsiW, M82 family [Salibacterium halotolerans]|uniref:Protease PrsW n=1 Tax=Salibacterium halotolerans TaxID=1884432 RepID=A0A1I5Q3N1_9BACI|nr:glutamic-type intramembrane protease PrsW [Salibacterium halotolerans]SFP40581.1 Membrane proteinase PrsW, cleaves anti-sigma factor RsiW, M82 family [Salibacterium halotolerans]
MIALITAALAPAIALLSYFYLRNEYESNTLIQVIRAFVIGALLVFPIMVLQYAMEAESLLTLNWVRAFGSAAGMEEFFKWFLLYFAVYRFVPLQTRYDGILYGAALSLGFASAENIMYLMALGIDSAIGRAFLPVSSHALFGVVMGYYMGSAKKQESGRHKLWMLLSIVVPIVLHGLYDYILLTIHENVLYIIVPFMFFLWWFALSRTKKADGKTA